MSDSGKDKVVKLRRRRLTDEEKIGILLDLENEVPWRTIREKRGVSQSTISAVRKELLQDTRLIELIKASRLPRLCQLTDKCLDVLDGKEPEEATTRDVATLYGILEDKILTREGRPAT